MSEQLEKWVEERRDKLGATDRPKGVDEIWGLALSGGGIRSATFSFGLVRALAKYGSLPRFDVVSTVSGGGYIGAALGKLFDQAQSPADVAQVHATFKTTDHNWFAWWLRANGRYLIPRGFKDSLFAIALYARNLLGVHVELGVLALLLAMVLAFINIGAWTGLAALPGGPMILAGLPTGARWLPTLWLLLLPATLAGIVLMCSYWTLPEPGSRGSYRSHGYMVVALASLLALVVVRPPLANLDRITAVWLAAVLIVTGWGLAYPLSSFALARARVRRDPSATSASGDELQAEALVRDKARNLLTNWLSALGRFGVAVLGLGAMDRLAWYLAFEIEAVQSLAVALAVAIALLRTLLPKLVPSSTTAQPTLGVGLAALGNVAGYLMLCSVVLLWLTAFNKLFFADSISHSLSSPRALKVSIAVMLILCGYAWITRYNFGFLNLSSLHNFYRARITRGFLGAANGERFPPFPPMALNLHSLDPVPDEAPSGGLAPKEVNDVHPGDDVEMAKYKPHRHGGPVHLINVCVNETSDPRGGLFNQDRRGLPMVIGPEARVRVGSQSWQTAQGDGALTLGRWTAISGAAFAPGLGQMTRGGVAALSTLAGLRLGYWWDSRSLHTGDDSAHSSPRNCKSRGLLHELLGKFQAKPGQNWYLSDGGHYENTGALTLLAEEARIIVLADCGADPRYAFNDLENLVRKARIDLQAEIEFLRPCANQSDHHLEAFGSLDDLASLDSQACLALARVHYTRTDHYGYLVLVKPNLSSGMTADLVNFKQDNPDFPQETTTDQFFGEAQWESYYKLGRVIGRNLQFALLQELPHIATVHFEGDIGPRAKQLAGKDNKDDRAAADAKPTEGTVRLPSRIARSAVATTVGMGAVATLGISVWQALDGARASYTANRQTEEAALKELADRYGAWVDGKPESLGPVAASLLRAADRPCNDGDNSWFRSSLLAQCVLKEVLAACEAGASDKLAACRMLSGSEAISCLAPRLRQQSYYWSFQFADPQSTRAESCPTPGRATLISQPASPAPVPPAASQALPVPEPPPPVTAKVCNGKTVNVQIFSGGQRDALRAYRNPWRQLGASVPPIEDVLATAHRAGRTPPRSENALTRTYYHDEDSRACARALVVEARLLDTGLPSWADPQPLPSRLRAIPGTIEIWVAPATAASTPLR